MTDKIYISDSVTSSDSKVAASSKAVKEAYDKANNANAAVNAIDVGVTSFNGSKGAVTYTAPVTSVMGQTGDITGLVKSVNGVNADAEGNVDVATSMTTREVFTSSTTFTTPKAGVYTFILVGGGQGGYNASSDGYGGKGGNGGKYFEMSLYLEANTSCAITIGAGGARGGKEGGQSKVTANNITYTSGAGVTISIGGTPGTGDDASITTNGGNSAFGGTGGAKKTLSPGGGGGFLLNGITAPTAGSATSGYKSDNGAGGYGFGAGGAGGGDPYGGSNYGYGGAGAAGIVVVYY